MKTSKQLILSGEGVTLKDLVASNEEKDLNIIILRKCTGLSDEDLRQFINDSPSNLSLISIENCPQLNCDELMGYCASKNITRNSNLHLEAETSTNSNFIPTDFKPLLKASLVIGR